MARLDALLGRLPQDKRWGAKLRRVRALLDEPGPNLTTADAAAIAVGMWVDIAADVRRPPGDHANKWTRA